MNSDLVDEQEMCDPLEEATGGFQDSGWETYWGKNEDIYLYIVHFSTENTQIWSFPIIGLHQMCRYVYDAVNVAT